MFDKTIGQQTQFCARLRAKCLKQIASLLGKIRPGERHGDRFRRGNPLYTLAVAAGPVEAEDGPPVMHDPNNPVPEIERLPQRVEIVTMLGIGITLGPRRIELVRRAHRSEESRVGKECGSKCSYRRGTEYYKNTEVKNILREEQLHI